MMLVPIIPILFTQYHLPCGYWSHLDNIIALYLNLEHPILRIKLLLSKSRVPNSKQPEGVFFCVCGCFGLFVCLLFNF